MKNTNQIILSLFLFLFLFSVSASAQDDMESLRQQIRALQERVDELEQNQVSVETTPEAQEFIDEDFFDWDPFINMQRMHEHMQSMFDSGFGQMDFSEPKLAMRETDKGYEVTIDIVGFDKDKINVKVHNQAIVISGERTEKQENKNPNAYFHSQSFGSFLKTLPIPVDADIKKVNIKKKDDQITIQIPRKKVKNKKM